MHLPFRKLKTYAIFFKARKTGLLLKHPVTTLTIFFKIFTIFNVKKVQILLRSSSF